MTEHRCTETATTVSQIRLPDHALWPRLPYGFAFHTRAYYVDMEIQGETVRLPKVDVSLLKGSPFEIAANARYSWPPVGRIAHGTIDVQLYGSGSAVLELMADLKRRSNLTGGDDD